MPPRGRSTRSTAPRRAATSSKSSQRQSALTFSNSRVTKASTATTSAKDKKAKAEAEAKAAKLLQEQEESATQEEVEDVIVDDDEQEEEELAEPQTQIPIRTQTQPQVQSVASTGPEATAKKISETQIRSYWKAKEAERKTPRVHQDDLSLYEKVLREFDMSNQYGPCVGITRMKRWNRAQNLGLQPPIEVLAVLLKGEKGGKEANNGRAYMDVLINTRLGIVAQ